VCLVFNRVLFRFVFFFFFFHRLLSFCQQQGTKRLHEKEEGH